jgi:hypothetical protein
LIQRGPAISVGNVLSQTSALSSKVHTATAGVAQLITPAISNDTRLNYSRQTVGVRTQLDDFGGAAPLPDVALFPSGFTSENSTFGFYIVGAGQWNQGRPQTNGQRQFNLVDNLSVTIRAHQAKFGVDYRRLAPATHPYTYRQYVQFSGVSTTAGGALSGIAQAASVNNYQGNALISQNFSLYGQDTWKLTPRFTLTYGLRWDVNPPLRGKNAANDPFTVTGLDNLATLALAPRGTPLYKTTYGNVAPRLGIAWQFLSRQEWSTVLRAGAGVFYDLGQGSVGGTTSYFPYIASKSIQAVPFPLSSLDAAPPPLSLDPPVITLVVADPHLKLPRSYQWNVALEQSLGRSQSVSLTYIGAIGRDLLRVTQLTNLNPSFASISFTTGDATSDYHALQSKFQRRLSRGLQVLASYTFSHSIDSASTDAFATRLNTPASIADPNVDRGNSDFDIRHTFTAGATYDLPTLRSNPVLRAALGGWSVDAFVLGRSAPPVNVVGTTFNVVGATLSPRPNVVSGATIELFGSGYPGGKVFSKAAFIQPPAGQQGNFGRNVLRGFDAAQADVSLQRQFRVTEKVGLRFRAEFFNILNHPNFANPVNSLTNALFGRSTQTLANGLGSGGANGGFNPLFQIGGPRSVQLALKLKF